MSERCQRKDHAEGDLDDRIVGFYEQLRGEFPDSPPYPAGCPWMSMPLGVLVLRDPQAGSAQLP